MRGKYDPNTLNMLKRFITKNHNLVKEYHDCNYNRVKEQDWKEQLRILFVSALSAGGEGNISGKAESVKQFEKNVKKMKFCSYEDLLKAFKAKNYTELFDKLRGFKQIGAKKSALFLRDILFFKNIIKNTPSNLIRELLVPADRVIVRTVNSIFEKDFKPGRSKTFDEINKMAKQIFPDKPILFEDLWFWGRFYRCKENKKSKIPYCRFNRDLLLVDIGPTKEYRDKLLKFSKRRSNCPFKEICSNV
jgi:hypothetical protein